VDIKRMQWLFPTRRYGRSLKAKERRLAAAMGAGKVKRVTGAVEATPPSAIGAVRESAKPLRKLPRA